MLTGLGSKLLCQIYNLKATSGCSVGEALEYAERISKQKIPEPAATVSKKNKGNGGLGILQRGWGQRGWGQRSGSGETSPEWWPLSRAWCLSRSGLWLACPPFLPQPPQALTPRGGEGHGKSQPDQTWLWYNDKENHFEPSHGQKSSVPMFADSNFRWLVKHSM